MEFRRNGTAVDFYHYIFEIQFPKSRPAIYKEKEGSNEGR